MGYHSRCVNNCGGTDCPAPVRYVTYTGTSDRCKHENTSEFRVYFLFGLFPKWVKVCWDCEEMIKR